MNATGSEQSERPDRRPPAKALLAVLAAAGALALAIALLARVDARRAEEELAELERQVCAPALDSRLLERADELWGDARRDKDRMVELLAEIHAQLGRGSQLTLFFEAEATLWEVESYYGATPTGATDWPLELARWEEVAWSDGCRAVRDGRRLIAARTLRTPRGRFIVTVAWRRRSTG